MKLVTYLAGEKLEGENGIAPGVLESEVWRLLVAISGVV